MRVEIPKNQVVIVKVSGANWAYPVYQSIPGWKNYDLEQNGDKTIRKFKNLKTGIYAIGGVFHQQFHNPKEHIFYKGSKRMLLIIFYAIVGVFHQQLQITMHQSLIKSIKQEMRGILVSSRGRSYPYRMNLNLESSLKLNDPLWLLLGF